MGSRSRCCSGSSYINLLLAVFNLIPIPPLDGYNVVLPFLPPRTAMIVQRYAPYGVIVLLLLILIPGSPLRLLFQIVSPDHQFPPSGA